MHAYTRVLHELHHLEGLVERRGQRLLAEGREASSDATAQGRGVRIRGGGDHKAVHPAEEVVEVDGELVARSAASRSAVSGNTSVTTTCSTWSSAASVAA